MEFQTHTQLSLQIIAFLFALRGISECVCYCVLVLSEDAAGEKVTCTCGRVTQPPPTVCRHSRSDQLDSISRWQQLASVYDGLD